MVWNSEVSVTGLWKYDHEHEKWVTVSLTGRIEKTVIPESQKNSRGLTDPLVMVLPQEAGLFWIGWKEGNVSHGAFAFSGPVLCNDVSIGPRFKGDKVATCIPFKDHAIAAYVPDPKIHCQ
jgi:hypothetical protein